MRIFAAASMGDANATKTNVGDSYNEFMTEIAYRHVLVSYFYDPRCDFVNGRGIAYKPDFVVTDSGAFTVWRSGETIDLGAYIDYCHRYRERQAAGEVPPAVHVSLDVIPGAEGRTPTPRERKAGIKQSLANGDRMRAAGIPIMEVFHHYEPPEFLRELRDRRQPGDLLGLSPRNDAVQPVRRRFLDGVFHQLLSGTPLDQVPPCHGLGVGGKELLCRYPWWSCDALTWVVNPGQYGRVMGRDGASRRLTYDQTKGIKGRRRYCIEYLNWWTGLENSLTDVWAKRGVAWQTPPKP